MERRAVELMAKGGKTVWAPEDFQQASLMYWFPKLRDPIDKGLVATPETRILKISAKDLQNLYAFLDGKGDPAAMRRLAAKIGEAAVKLGGPPAFLRTDHTSGKHDFERSCFVNSLEPAEIAAHVIALFEDSILKDLPMKALVVREYIKPKEGFRAFRGLPIGRERRYFVCDGQVLCHHPYWPEDAIRFRKEDEPGNWKEILEDLNREAAEEISILSRMASEASKAVPGFWSVDFMQAEDGRWLLIDMAPGRMSWHPEDCPNRNPEASR